MNSSKAERVANRIVAVLVSVMTLFTTAWYFMLGVGIVHLHWLPGMPTIGYNNALWIMLLLNFILDAAALRAHYDNKGRKRGVS